MRNCFDIAFTPSPDHPRESWTNELHVAADSEVSVQLRMDPRLHFRQDEFIIGFEGFTQRPRVLRAFDPFVKVGKRREQSPETNPDHYIDAKDRYHIAQKVERTAGNTFSYSFMVKTYLPGRFVVIIRTMTDCGEGRPRQSLVLVVDP